MKPSDEEINNTNENSINPDINLLLRNEVFKIPEIYKQDYRWKNDEEQKKMMKNFIEKYSKKDAGNEKKYDDFDDVIDFKEVRFEEVNNWWEIEYRESEKPKKVWKKIKDEELYSFKIEEIIKLRKYLKSKIYGQDNIIDQCMDLFLMNIYRTHNNSNHLNTIIQAGNSWTGKNFLWELIARKLDFTIEIIDLSQYHYIEIASLTGVTQWYNNSSEESIIENIYNKSKNGKVIIIFDELEKWKKSENWDINTFFTWIMNLIWGKEIRTKDTNKHIIMSNTIFVFNTNIWFDTFQRKETNRNKIWFDIWNNSNNKEIKIKIDADYIKDYFKNTLKINVSTYNRLIRSNNVFVFNNLKKTILDEYKINKYEELKKEISENLGIDYNKLPSIDYFENMFRNYDLSRAFRGLNDIIFIDIKLYLIKKYWFKNKLKI